MAKSPLRIRIYTTRNCTHCRRLKDFLRRQGVAFSEQDVERNRRAFSEFQRHGGRAVPLLVIGQDKLAGFDEKKLRRLLTGAGFRLA